MAKDYAYFYLDIDINTINDAFAQGVNAIETANLYTDKWGFEDIHCSTDDYLHKVQYEFKHNSDAVTQNAINACIESLSYMLDDSDLLRALNIHYDDNSDTFTLYNWGTSEAVADNLEDAIHQALIEQLNKHLLVALACDGKTNTVSLDFRKEIEDRLADKSIDDAVIGACLRNGDLTGGLAMIYEANVPQTKAEQMKSIDFKGTRVRALNINFEGDKARYMCYLDISGAINDQTERSPMSEVAERSDFWQSKYSKERFLETLDELPEQDYDIVLSVIEQRDFDELLTEWGSSFDLCFVIEGKDVQKGDDLNVCIKKLDEAMRYTDLKDDVSIAVVQRRHDGSIRQTFTSELTDAERELLLQEVARYINTDLLRERERVITEERVKEERDYER